MTWITAIPAPFTVDENNYLVSILGLRDGPWGLPGTEGFAPSPELLFFDPQGRSRQIEDTPVVATVPPLYSLIAYPFLSWAGWYGLVAINILAWLTTTAILFRLGARLGGRGLQWFVAVVYLLACPTIEYAQGMWPHALAIALTTSCFLGVVKSWESRDSIAVGWLVFAGVVAGLAAGIRYQNVLLAFLVGFGVFLGHRRRLLATAAFLTGLAVPLVLSSMINVHRLNSFNPISKGPGYLALGPMGDEDSTAFLKDVATMFWARVVDYGVRPEPVTQDRWFKIDDEAGVYLVYGAMKKSLMQSAPWLLLAWLSLLSGGARWMGAGNSTLQASIADRMLGTAFLVVMGVLVVFALFGSRRHDGLAFNQRYFLELVPFLLLGLGAAVEGLLPRGTSRGSCWLVGGVLGAVLPLLWIDRFYFGLRWTPVALGVLLCCAYCWRSRFRSGGALLLGLLAASLSWGGTVHFGDDLVASRELRRLNLDRREGLEDLLGEPAAVFAWGATVDALGPLLIDYDIVLLAPSLDAGRSMPDLAQQAEASGRRVWVVSEPTSTDLPRPLTRSEKQRSWPPLDISLVRVTDEVGP